MICGIEALCWSGIGCKTPSIEYFYTEVDALDKDILKIGNFVIRKSCYTDELSYTYLILNREFLPSRADAGIDIKIEYVFSGELSIVLEHDKCVLYYDDHYLIEREIGGFQRYNNIDEVLDAIKFFKNAEGNQFSYIAGDYKIEACNWRYIEANYFKEEKQNNSLEQAPKKEKPIKMIYMIYKVETLCWEYCEKALPVKKTIYISGMPINLHEKIKIGFFLRKKETNDKDIYYLIKRVECFSSEEEKVTSGIRVININEFELFLKHNGDVGWTFINGIAPSYYINKNKKIYCYSNLVRFLNEIKDFEDDRDNYKFNLSYSNNIEKMDFSSVEKCFERTAKQLCLKAYYWDSYQTHGKMKTKHIKITGCIEKINELIRIGVFFFLKQEDGNNLGVVRQVYSSDCEKFDMSVDLEDIKILFTPKDKFVLDFRGMYFLNGNDCGCDLADSLHETTFSDKDGRVYLFNSNGRSFFDEDVSAPLILKTWFSPKINCLNIKDGISLVSEINENTPHYVMSSYGTVQSINPQTCYAWCENKKEEHNMFSNLMKNLEFGKINTNAIKYSFNGIAFATNDGSYVVYNSDMTFTNVSDMVMDIPIYAMPVAKSDIEVGDIIKHYDTFVIVQSITDTEIRVANPLTREVVNIIPEKSIFGFDFYSKVIDFTKNFNTGATESNPFGNLPLLMMMDNKKDNDALMYFMMMNGGKINFNSPMMMYLMMSNSDDKSNLLPLMMLMNQNKSEESTTGYKINNSESNIVLNTEGLNWYSVD